MLVRMYPKDPNAVIKKFAKDPNSKVWGFSHFLDGKFHGYFWIPKKPCKTTKKCGNL